jgi:hypothetical protein
VSTIRGLLIGYLVIALVTGWPVASVIVAGAIASWNGCTLNEGSVNPCVVNGTDWGPALYSMGVAGWFMLATIPIGAIAFAGWTIGWVIWRNVRSRRAG